MNLNERDYFVPRNDYVRKTFPNKRFKHTLEFLNKHISTTQTILDLGEKSFSRIMKEEGFSVTTQVVKI
jgi:hypothetical protein